jgi:hypothetical protein
MYILSAASTRRRHPMRATRFQTEPETPAHRWARAAADAHAAIDRLALDVRAGLRQLDGALARIERLVQEDN